MAEPERPDLSWIAALCLSTAIALLMIAAGHGAGRRAEATASLLFWSGIALLLGPLVYRIAAPQVARAERLILLILLAEGFFFLKVLYSPTSFTDFDELLHWISADDILRYRRLFIRNPLLPISTFYPAIEILTTALANLTGFGVFASANVVLFILHAIFVATLFLFFERLVHSSRISALSSVIYMGCANFIIFDIMFAYESLGIVLALLAIQVEAGASGSAPSANIGKVLLIGLLLASLAVTHHVSAIFCAAYFAGLLIIEVTRRSDGTSLRQRLGVTPIATALAVILPLLWMQMPGNTVAGYLGPVLQSGIAELSAKAHGASAPREMFVGADGSVQPIGYRLASVGSILLIALGLSTGFFRSLALGAGGIGARGWRPLLLVLRRRWTDSRVVFITLVAFGFPISVAFRLTAAGWEIGNRMTAFIFVAVGFVAAMSIVHFWQARITRSNVPAVSCAIFIILLGGITVGWGGRAVHGGYRVGADPESIEPMGIQAALWTRTWLGEGNRFAADRTNMTLLGTYGGQDVVSSLGTRLDISRAFLGKDLSPETLYPLRLGRVGYLLVDLRMSTAPALLGEYFDKNETGHGRPPPPSRLLKFDDAKGVSRIFDNGWLVVFDVRRLYAL
ncbi:MAG: hypothetical protein JO001_22390 [Alphaproteobacteria bacterium]|nr:hypothetical protein [Alphaproteobacteria bacterium]